MSSQSRKTRNEAFAAPIRPITWHVSLVSVSRVCEKAIDRIDSKAFRQTEPKKTWRGALPMLGRRRRKSSRELSISLTRTLIPRLTSSRELQSQRELFFCCSFSRLHTTVGRPIHTHRASFCALNLQTCSALRAFSAWQTFNRRRFTSLHARSFSYIFICFWKSARDIGISNQFMDTVRLCNIVDPCARQICGSTDGNQTVLRSNSEIDVKIKSANNKRSGRKKVCVWVEGIDRCSAISASLDIRYLTRKHSGL